MKLFSLMFLFAIVGALFTSCSSDDDENEGASGNENLVGFWLRYEDNDQYLEEFGFFADGTCIYTKSFEPDDDKNEDSYYEFGKGTYVVKGNKLTMKLKFDDEYEVWTYTIKNLKAKNTLVLVDKDGSTHRLEYYLED